MLIVQKKNKRLRLQRSVSNQKKKFGHYLNLCCEDRANEFYYDSKCRYHNNVRDMLILAHSIKEANEILDSIMAMWNETCVKFIISASFFGFNIFDLKSIKDLKCKRIAHSF